MATETTAAPPRRKETLDSAVIRFAGDSGDGMQITGSQFTNTTALFGNDIATFPDFPAEIRAPAGTLPGVSGFQIHFGAKDIFTPGDAVDVLIAMNPAALKMNLADLKTGGILVVNVDNFKETDLKKAQVAVSPLEDHSLEGYRLFPVELTKLTRAALKDLGLDAKSMDRCKNFFALGMCYWLYNRTMDATHRWLDEKFGAKPVLAEANKLAMKAGYAFCDATEAFQVTYEVPPAKLAPGVYRNLSGNTALAMGFVVAAQKAGLRLFQGSYPITPASDILHELSMYKEFGVITFQAEDEIAAITSAIGASYAGSLAITTTSGPGMALKGEALGLATMVELPLVVVDIQRGGPSTGLPTKTEQADLFQALFGRNCEAPVPVIAASTPGDCFWVALEASRIALKYMVPVILLSDGYLANGAEPWRIPDLGRAAGDPGDVPHRARGLPALPARAAHAGAAVGRAGNAGARAPHRRPREAGRHRQRQLRAAQPRAHGPAARPEGGRHRPGHPRRGAGRRPRRRPADRRLGLDLRRHHRGAADAARGRPAHRPRAPAAPQPAARQPRRGAEALQARAGAGAEHGPAGVGAARPLPGRCRLVPEGAGQAVHAGRARSEDPVAAGQPRRCDGFPGQETT